MGDMIDLRSGCPGCMGSRSHEELDGEWQWVCKNIGCSDSILYVAQEHMDDVDWSPADYDYGKD